MTEGEVHSGKLIETRGHGALGGSPALFKDFAGLHRASIVGEVGGASIREVAPLALAVIKRTSSNEEDSLMAVLT